MPSDGSHEHPDSSRSASVRRWLARPRPVIVSLTSLALALEALALGVLTVVGLVRTVAPDGSDRVLAAVLALCTAATAWLLLACAASLGAGRSWVRGPAVTIQLLALLVAVTLLGAEQRGAAIALAIPAGATLVGLLTPAVARFTGRDARPFDED